MVFFHKKTKQNDTGVTKGVYFGMVGAMSSPVGKYNNDAQKQNYQYVFAQT